MNKTIVVNQGKNIERLIKEKNNHLAALLENIQEPYVEITAKINEVKYHDNYYDVLKEIDRLANMLELASMVNSEINELMQEMDLASAN